MDWYNVLYIAIGALLPAIGAFIVQLITEKKELAKEIRDENKQFFLDVVKTMTAAIAERPLLKETKIQLNDLRARFLLLLNQDWVEKYWNIAIYIMENKEKDFDLKKVQNFIQS